MDQLNTNFAVYKDSKEFMGIAQVTMPTLTYPTQEINGAGLSGSLEAIAQGHVGAMTLTLQFVTTTEESVKLSAPCSHDIELRVDQQYYDPISHQLKHRLEKHVMIIMPKTHSHGTVAPASQSNGSGEYAVHRWVTYIDGKRTRLIDPANYKCEIDGVDYLAVERKNLGRA